MNKDICYSYDGRLLEYGLLRPYSNIFAFSTTRHGGCSEGNYASFNANPYCGDQTDCCQPEPGFAGFSFACRTGRTGGSPSGTCVRDSDDR